MILAVTGHRPPKLGGYRVPNPIYTAVREGLRQKFRELSPSLVLSGMALGVDQWAAEVCCEEGIPFDAIIPFQGFESRWPDQAKRHYDYLRSRARSQHTVNQTREYRSGLLQMRNRWLVDHSEWLLAVWNGSAGGTGNCIAYAQTRGKPITRLELPAHIWEEAAAHEAGGQTFRRRSTPVREAIQQVWEETARAPLQWQPLVPEPAVQVIRGQSLQEIFESLYAPPPAEEPVVAPEPTKPHTDTFKPGRIINLDD